MATIRRRRGKYEVQIRRSGLPHVSRSFHALTDARTWARQMEVQADRGDLPADPKALQKVILGELVARYRDTVSIRKRGYDVERIVLDAFLRHPICKRRLSEITATDFAQYRDERLDSVKPATLKRQLGPIRNLFNVARDEWGLPIRENPLAKLKFNAIDQRRERRLRPGELDKLIKTARSRRNPLIAPIIRLALETGMRRGEMLAVRRRHVDFAKRTLLIPDGKNGHSRVIPLTKAATALLRSCSRERLDQIFPVTANAFRLAWDRIKRVAAIKDLRFHDLRHEAISRFFEKGLTIPEVALISGHRDMRTLFRYAHATREQIISKLHNGTRAAQSREYLRHAP
jgi:integrase